MRNKSYEAPQFEVVEIEIEGAVLTPTLSDNASNQSNDFGYGGRGW